MPKIDSVTIPITITREDIANLCMEGVNAEKINLEEVGQSFEAHFQEEFFKPLLETVVGWVWEIWEETDNEEEKL